MDTFFMLAASSLAFKGFELKFLVIHIHERKAAPLWVNILCHNEPQIPSTISITFIERLYRINKV